MIGKFHWWGEAAEEMRESLSGDLVFIVCLAWFWFFWLCTRLSVEFMECETYDISVIYTKKRGVLWVCVIKIEAKLIY